MPASEVPGWIQQWSAQSAWLISGEARTRDEIVLMVAAHNHRQWLDRVVCALEGQGVSTAATTDEHACAFGSWYRGYGASHFGQSAGYQAIGRAHHQAHAIADELLAQADRGEIQVARARSSELYAAHDALMTELADLVQAVKPMRRWE